MSRNSVQLKQILTRVGARCSQRSLTKLQATLNYMKLGRWTTDRGFANAPQAKNRWGVFDAVIPRVQDKKVLYLEFGVFEGETTRYWSERLRHPKSRLHGFDSFEGLPEDWGPHGKGHFDVKGALPKIDDPRVKFFKGWFNETLPTYTVPQHEVLVLILDADLYSSTKCVLTHLRDHIKPGDFVYFDELNEVDHEPRAFDEFRQETGLKFKPVCIDHAFQFAFFECV
jgi:hypothetical protein